MIVPSMTVDLVLQTAPTSMTRAETRSAICRSCQCLPELSFLWSSRRGTELSPKRRTLLCSLGALPH